MITPRQQQEVNPRRPVRTIGERKNRAGGLVCGIARALWPTCERRRLAGWSRERRAHPDRRARIAGGGPTPLPDPRLHDVVGDGCGRHRNARREINAADPNRDALLLGSAGKGRPNRVGRNAGTDRRRCVSECRSITAKGTTTTLKGSGIVIRSDGMVLTNNHIVADVGVNGGEIIVDFADGHIAPAIIVGRSPEDDVAVIQVQHSEGLRPATLGSSAGLRVGEQVLAIGNALGYPGTVTAGIVSALGRELCLTGDTTPSVENKQLYGTQPWLPAEVTLKNLIQTDAPINQGTSGDALVDIKGRVVGMCTAFDAPAGSGNIGVGFAIPIESAYDIAPRSSEVPGSAERSVLGKGRRLFPNDVFAALGLTDSVVTTKGVIIATYRPAWTGGRPDMRWGSFGPNLCEDHDSTVCSWIRERMTRSTAPRG
ncbi:MAG: S1C family serine protease [Actinomycetota bacterium]